MNEPTAERTDWYELLCRFADLKGWRVLIHSVTKGSGTFGMVHGRYTQPTVIEVRRDGETIAHAYIGDHDPREALNDAADAVLTQLEMIGEPFDRKAA